jgi:Domain of unknown function (DUF4365)
LKGPALGKEKTYLTAETWLEKLLPVILIVYDAPGDIAHRLYVQAYFTSQANFSLERLSERTSIRVPRANVVNQEAIRVFTRFRDDILSQVEGRVSAS